MMLNPGQHGAWLQLTEEEPIEPDLPICDPHHHLWDGPGDRGRYLVDEFLRDVSGGHRVVGTVFAECGAMYRTDGPQEMRSVGETEYAQSVAAACADGEYGMPLIADGIIGWADLTLGADVAPVLEAHIAAGGNHFRGIRQSCTWDINPAIPSMAKHKGMMSDDQFREGFACLEKYGLSFDAWQYHTQLMELAAVAKEYPRTPIVVNHTGGLLGVWQYAGKGKAIFREWERGIRELASCPNVAMKLGGLGMPRCGFGWHERAIPPGSVELAETMAPYFRLCIEAFGADRCMFESNFPVDKVSYSYTVLWNAFKRICKDYSASERATLLHDTAVSVYRLKD